MPRDSDSHRVKGRISLEDWTRLVERPVSLKSWADERRRYSAMRSDKVVMRPAYRLVWLALALTLMVTGISALFLFHFL